MTDNIDDAEEPTLYYVLSLTYTHRSDYAVWYRPDSRGYTTSLDSAGKYTQSDVEKPGFIDGKDCVAVRCNVADGMAFRAVSAQQMLSSAWTPGNARGGK